MPGPYISQVYSYYTPEAVQTGAPSYCDDTWAVINVRYIIEPRAAAGRLAPGALVIGSCFPMQRRYVGV
jgi:hypothetical protein